jgi:hypothetical protein
VNRNIEQILYEGIDRARRAGGRSA